MRLTVNGATKAFRSRPVFEDFSAEFRGNEVTAVVGPSGSGKSTLLAAIAGLQRLDRGSVELEFDDGVKRRPDPRDFAWVVQSNSAITGRSALDNTMIGAFANGADLAEAKSAALRAMETVGIEHLADQPVRELSGGERQRVGFARALTAGRRYILADEPSSSLDESNTRRLADVLLSLRSRATVIVATHDPLIINSVQRVILMRGSSR